MERKAIVKLIRNYEVSEGNIQISQNYYSSSYSCKKKSKQGYGILLKYIWTQKVNVDLNQKKYKIIQWNTVHCLRILTSILNSNYFQITVFLWFVAPWEQDGRSHACGIK